jgi:hypothetical protein
MKRQGHIHRPGVPVAEREQVAGADLAAFEQIKQRIGSRGFGVSGFSSTNRRTPA